MSDRRAVLGIALVLLLVVPSGAAAPSTASPPEKPLHPGIETDRIVLTASVQPDGDAEWRVEYITKLGSDRNKTEGFQALVEDVRANPDNYTDRFADRIRDTVRVAENATGRNMTASNFSVAARTTVTNGVVVYSFEWSNFANVTGENRMVVGDGVEGIFLDDKMRLELQWPDEWAAVAVAPPPDSSPGQTVIWKGTSSDFAPGQPEVVLERGASTPTTTGTRTETDDGTGPGDTATTTAPGDGPGTGTVTETVGAGAGTGQGGSGLPMEILTVVALILVGAALVWWRRPGPSGPAAGTKTQANGGRGPADAAAVPEAESPAETEPESEPEQEEIDPELLSNEERVLRLLEKNGGRMKQQEVVEELGWTEAKTSQVVTGMREEGEIDAFRLGRENVLTLPDKEIDPTERDDDSGGSG